MDGIAKFIGYIVLACVALAWLGDRAEADKTPTTARTVATTPARDRCTEPETVATIRRIAPDLLTRTNDFGENITPRVASCRYDVAQDTMLVALHVGWRGPLTGDYYEKAGWLTLGAQTWRWEETGANENLRAYRLLVGMAGLLAAAR